jgi:hypothetical protein
LLAAAVAVAQRLTFQTVAVAVVVALSARIPRYQQEPRTRLLLEQAEVAALAVIEVALGKTAPSLAALLSVVVVVATGHSQVVLAALAVVDLQEMQVELFLVADRARLDKGLRVVTVSTSSHLGVDPAVALVPLGVREMVVMVFNLQFPGLQPSMQAAVDQQQTLAVQASAALEAAALEATHPRELQERLTLAAAVVALLNKRVLV